jgi:streptogramin lyase
MERRPSVAFFQGFRLMDSVIAPDGSVWFGLLRGNSIGRMRDGEMGFST